MLTGASATILSPGGRSGLRLFAGGAVHGDGLRTIGVLGEDEAEGVIGTVIAVGVHVDALHRVGVDASVWLPKSGLTFMIRTQRSPASGAGEDIGDGETWLIAAFT